MTDHPILFSGPMVRALLEGRKTQTRRVLKPQPQESWHSPQVSTGLRSVSWTSGEGYVQDCRVPAHVGDRLWVRETHGFEARLDLPKGQKVKYRATNGLALPPDSGWKPSIHMPRWASRLTLTVTDVRVQRLQDISEEDAKAEGAGSLTSNMPGVESVSHVQSFQKLWDSLNADRGFGWQANPWIVAYTFTVHPQNIDQEGDNV
ncbi:MAG: hypothetical protein AAFX90_10240 [Pseudomonadota bacterium]